MKFLEHNQNRNVITVTANDAADAEIFAQELLDTNSKELDFPHGVNEGNFLTESANDVSEHYKECEIVFAVKYC